MVISKKLSHARRQTAALITEAIVAMGILAAVMIPVSYSFLKDQAMCRTYYRHAVAMEIVDGEIEILRAGEWRQFKQGSQPYEVHAESATNLPPGCFVLTLADRQVRLEWIPEQKGQGGKVVREGMVQ